MPLFYVTICRLRPCVGARRAPLIIVLMPSWCLAQTRECSVHALTTYLRCVHYIAYVLFLFTGRCGGLSWPLRDSISTDSCRVQPAARFVHVTDRHALGVPHCRFVAGSWADVDETLDHQASGSGAVGWYLHISCSVFRHTSVTGSSMSIPFVPTRNNRITAGSGLCG
jgi:hypothetical protein